jgi:hypothetical protein
VVAKLGQDVPARFRRALESSGRLTVAAGDISLLAVDGLCRPLVLLPRPSPHDPEQAVHDLAASIPPGHIGVVVGSGIPVAERTLLEEAGLSWCDERGAVHFEWPGVLVHIDGVSKRVGASRSTPGIGPVGIRAVQTLLEAPSDDWTTTKLADDAGVSLGQAHKVLNVLDEEHLLETLGRGRLQRRRISDYRGLLDWLSVSEHARRKPLSIPVFLYARTPDELFQRLSERAQRAGVSVAVTGLAASHILGFTLVSTLSISHVRVHLASLEEAVEQLGFERLSRDDTGRGSNIELWLDSGGVGTHRARDIHGVPVAPDVRIWLDMLREGGRTTDAATHFREVVLERR